MCHPTREHDDVEERGHVRHKCGLTGTVRYTDDSGDCECMRRPRAERKARPLRPSAAEVVRG